MCSFRLWVGRVRIIVYRSMHLFVFTDTLRVTHADRPSTAGIQPSNVIFVFGELRFESNIVRCLYRCLFSLILGAFAFEYLMWPVCAFSEQSPFSQNCLELGCFFFPFELRRSNLGSSSILCSLMSFYDSPSACSLGDDQPFKRKDVSIFLSCQLHFATGGEAVDDNEKGALPSLMGAPDVRG